MTFLAVAAYFCTISTVLDTWSLGGKPNSAAQLSVRLLTTAERVLLLQAREAHTPVSQLSKGSTIESVPLPALNRMGSSIDGFRHAMTSGLEDMLINFVVHPSENLPPTMSVSIITSIY